MEHIHGEQDSDSNKDGDPLPVGPSLDIEHMMERRPWGMDASSDDAIEYMDFIARFQDLQSLDDRQTDRLAMINEQRRRYELALLVLTGNTRPTTAALRIIRSLARISF